MKSNVIDPLFVLTIERIKLPFLLKVNGQDLNFQDFIQQQIPKSLLGSGFCKTEALPADQNDLIF